MADMSMKNYSFIESVLCESAPAVDREAGVIRHVKILGRKSKNGYEYSDKALREAASLYEGIRVNVDHPPRSTPGIERSIRDSFGELRGVQIESDGVYGDLHYNRRHPLAEQIVEAAERFPRQFGLSQNGEGSRRHVDGKWIVESVDRVRSVDIVGCPATTAGLFESVDETTGKDAEMAKKSLRQLVESADGKLKSRLAKLLEEEPGMAAMADAPVEMPADASVEEQVWAAFRSAMIAALDDDSLDRKATTKKIDKLLKDYESSFGSGGDSGGGSSDAASGGTSDGTAMESIMERIRKAEERAERAECRSLLESAGLEADDETIAALMPLDEAGRKTLIGRMRPARPTIQKPAFSRPLMESASGGTSSIPKFETPADRAAFLRRG